MAFATSGILASESAMDLASAEPPSPWPPRWHSPPRGSWRQNLQWTWQARSHLRLGLLDGLRHLGDLGVRICNGLGKRGATFALASSMAFATSGILASESAMDLASA